MTIEGADELQADLSRLLVGVSEPEVRRFMNGLGQDSKRDMAEGFTQDLGADRAMRNWPTRAKAPVALSARYDIREQTMVVRPDSKSAAPLSMLERGRLARRVGQFRGNGRKKYSTGLRTNLRLVSRTVGPMDPKDTWSDGAQIVERRFPSRADDWFRDVVRRAWR